jgi:hypothetical protein
MATQADGVARGLRRFAAALAGDFDVRKTGSPGERSTGRFYTSLSALKRP